MFKLILLLTLFNMTFGGKTWFEVPPKEEFRKLVKERLNEIEIWKEKLGEASEKYNLRENIPYLLEAFEDLTMQRKNAKKNALPFFEEMLTQFRLKPMPDNLRGSEILGRLLDIYKKMDGQLGQIDEKGVIPMRYLQILWSHFRQKVTKIISPRVFMTKPIYGELMFPKTVPFYWSPTSSSDPDSEEE